MVCCAAGPIAELVESGECYPLSPDDRDVIGDYGGGDADLKRMDYALLDLKAMDRNPRLKTLLSRALRLVETNYDAIEALTQRLLEEHCLDGAAVWETVAPFMVHDLKAAA